MTTTRRTTKGAAKAGRQVRRAVIGSASHPVARTGLVARGVLYLLIGWVAFMLAIGKTGREADQRGALQMFAGKSYGVVVLWLLVVGFAAYGLWCLSEAAFGAAGEGSGAPPRLRYLLSGLLYAAFAATTVSIVLGSRQREDQKQEDITARAMAHSGGRWLVAAVGVVVVIVGIVLAVEGVRHTFEKLLMRNQMSKQTYRVVKTLGTVGALARGVVVGLAGVLVVHAAIAYDPAKSGGVDGALRTLRDQPFGPYLLGAEAIGLAIFGVYGLCEARWRKV